MPFRFNPFINNLDEVNPPGTGVTVTTVTGNIGGAIPPTAGGNINILGATGITVTGAGNTLTISVSGNTQPWVVAGVSGNAAKNTGYFSTAAITLTLPTVVVDGDFVDFIADAAGLLTVQAGAGQIIRLGIVATGVAGTAVNTAQGDALSLVYRQATLTWIAVSSIGNWNLV